MDLALQTVPTAALVVGLALASKGVVGLVSPGRWGRLLRGLPLRSHPLTPKRLRNDRFANGSFVGIGFGIVLYSLVLPSPMAEITTAVGLCSGMVTWTFLRMEALAQTPVGDSSVRS